MSSFVESLVRRVGVRVQVGAGARPGGRALMYVYNIHIYTHLFIYLDGKFPGASEAGRENGPGGGGYGVVGGGWGAGQVGDGGRVGTGRGGRGWVGGGGT